MNIRRTIKTALWQAGYDFSRFAPNSHPIARKREMFSAYKVDTVIDIGANVGQFAEGLRRDLGYRGQILSFEPLNSAFAQLQQNARKDKKWKTFNLAIGDSEGTKSINIASNSFSSSLLKMLPLHLASAPESRYVGTQSVEVKTLDSIFAGMCEHEANIYMKIDTQGFEHHVIAGARNSLTHIDTVQMEMSLVPLYEGELLFDDMCRLMTANGYTLMRIDNGHTDPSSGRLLQVDGIFRRL